MSLAETCAVEHCRVMPEFPDTEGYLYCAEHYPLEDFEHMPEPRRSELQEAYHA